MTNVISLRLTDTELKLLDDIVFYFADKKLKEGVFEGVLSRSDAIRHALHAWRAIGTERKKHAPRRAQKVPPSQRNTNRSAIAGSNVLRDAKGGAS